LAVLLAAQEAAVWQEPFTQRIYQQLVVFVADPRAKVHRRNAAATAAAAAAAAAAGVQNSVYPIPSSHLTHPFPPIFFFSHPFPPIFFFPCAAHPLLRVPTTFPPPTARVQVRKTAHQHLKGIITSLTGQPTFGSVCDVTAEYCTAAIQSEDGTATLHALSFLKDLLPGLPARVVTAVVPDVLAVYQQKQPMYAAMANDALRSLFKGNDQMPAKFVQKLLTVRRCRRTGLLPAHPVYACRPCLLRSVSGRGSMLLLLFLLLLQLPSSCCCCLVLISSP